MRRKHFSVLVAGAAAALFAPAAQAALVQATFNDNAPGQLSGQSGGTGFSGAWQTATGPAVGGGDLTAPGSTNFALTQSGTAQSVQSGNTVISNNGATDRAVAATMTGTIWFSFLTNPASANARGGIGFNTVSATSNDPRILTVGTGLYVNGTTGLTPFTVGSTALVVGRIVINESGVNDRLTVWVNPDVNALASGVNAPAPAYNSAAADTFGTGITRVSVHSYTGTSGTAAGIVDAIRVSDTATAQTDVTGVPEPTAAGAFAAASGLLLAARRRRPSR